MYTGKVKFFNKAKGFGFILNSATDEDIFVHATCIKTPGDLRENDEVTFDIGEGKRGPMATNVRKV